MTDSNAEDTHLKSKRSSSKNNKSPPRKSQSLQSNNQSIKRRRSSQNNGLTVSPYMNTSIGNEVNNKLKIPFQNEESIQLLQLSSSAKISLFYYCICNCSCCNEKFFEIIIDKNSESHTIFTCKDLSGCCIKLLCSSKTRSVDLKWEFPNKKIFGYSEKKFDCGCCCLSNPGMVNKYKNDKTYGFVDQKCSFCTPYFFIFNKKDELKYSFEVPCCQNAFCCRKCCCHADNCLGYIYNKDNSNECVGNVEIGRNYYIIHFPLDANFEDKMNLINCVILFNLIYYSDSNETLFCCC